MGPRRLSRLEPSAGPRPSGHPALGGRPQSLLRLGTRSPRAGLRARWLLLGGRQRLGAVDGLDVALVVRRTARAGCLQLHAGAALRLPPGCAQARVLAGGAEKRGPELPRVPWWG